jgi:hypothetical protein
MIPYQLYRISIKELKGGAWLKVKAPFVNEYVFLF